MYAYYLGALRNLYSVNYKLSDYDTGEAYFDYTYLWVAKSAPTRTGYINTMGYPYLLDWDNIGKFGDFVNGERLLFTVEATLIDDEGNEHKQTIDYTIKVDNTRPVLIEDSAKLVYEDGRLYFTADFYDNEYLAFVYMSNPNTSTGVYRFDGEKGETLNFKVDVTDYYSQLKEDGTINIFVEDYAYNRSTYEVTLPMPEIRTAVPKELNITNSEEESILAINEYKEITFDILPYDFYDIISKEYIVADESIVRAQEDGMLGLASGETQITLIAKIEMYNGVVITLEDTFTVTVSEEVVKKTKGLDLYLTFDDPRYQDYVVGNSHGMLAGFTVFGGGSYLDVNVNPVPWYADDTFSTSLTFTSLSGDGSDYGTGGGISGLLTSVRVVGNRIYLDGYNARAIINFVLKGGVGTSLYLQVIKPLTATDEEEFVTYESNGITYLSRYNGTSEVVEIPEGVQIIGDYTFATRTNVKKVILPESCLGISSYAFAECSIEEIVINKELQYIGNYAFTGSKLKSIVMPEDSKLTDIGNSAFYKCEDLKYADFSNVIGDEEVEFLLFSYSAFYQCTSLEEIKFPATGYKYTLYPWCFQDCSSLKEVILDDNCIWINYQVFIRCTSLEKVVLPSTLEEISSGVFAGCTSLKSIEIPESVKRIYSNAFEESGLEEIFIGKNIKSIMYHAFLNCKNLKKIVFEEGFDGLYYNDDSIYSYYYTDDCIDIFSGCTSLEEVVLPDSVTRIPDGIFNGCTSLSSINIPEGVTSIGEYAFYNTALSTVKLPDSITSIGHYAFAESLFESVEFGNNLSVIGNYAFANTYLTEINIPEALTYIGNYAFSGVNLTISELRFNENLIFLGAYSFDSANIDDIYLPASLEAIDFSVNSTARYHIDENCELVKEIDNGIYANGGNILMFYQGISLEVEIAEGTARIHQGAFAKRSSISSLIIPASVQRIGDGVFNFEIGYVRFLGDAPILEYTDKINTFLPGTTIYVNANAKGFDGAEWSDYNIIYLSEGLLLNEKIASAKTDDEIVKLYNEFIALSEMEQVKVTNASKLLNKYMEIIAKRDAKALEEARKALEEANENNKKLAEELEESIKANEELQRKYNEVTNMPSCGAQSDISVISIISFVILAFAVVFLTLKKKNKKD